MNGGQSRGVSWIVIHPGMWERNQEVCSSQVVFFFEKNKLIFRVSFGYQLHNQSMKSWGFLCWFIQQRHITWKQVPRAPLAITEEGHTRVLFIRFLVLQYSRGVEGSHQRRSMGSMRSMKKKNTKRPRPLSLCRSIFRVLRGGQAMSWPIFLKQLVFFGAGFLGVWGRPSSGSGTSHSWPRWRGISCPVPPRFAV